MNKIADGLKQAIEGDATLTEVEVRANDGPTIDAMSAGITALRDAGLDPLRLWSLRAPKDAGGVSVGPTAKALRALSNRPMTNAELQDVLEDDSSAVARIMANQRQRGNVTSTATGKGSIATYALTSLGRERIS